VIRWQKFLRDDHGRVTAFVVVITTACLVFAGLVLDGGFTITATIRAIGQAQEAARAAAQELDLTTYRRTGEIRLNPTAAHTAAQRYLASVGATGTVTITRTTATVHVHTHQPTRLLQLIGISDIPISGTGNAHPNQEPAGGPG
jgi:Flp pilus assembly protein TadG